MSHRIDRSQARQAERLRREQQARRQRIARRAGYGVVATIAVALVTLAIVAGQGGGSSRAVAVSASAGTATVGGKAPAFALTDVVSGKQVTLQSLAGHKTLLFFSEGAGCQACLVQAADLQRSRALAAAAIRLVSVTTDQPGVLAQAAGEYAIHTPMLADSTTRMSAAYGMLAHGGMEHSGEDGHAFMLLSANGTVLWHRAYPQMYVATSQLLADMKAKT